MTERVEWVCAVLLEFPDQGPGEARIISKGSEEECRNRAEDLGTVTYSGSRPKPQATVLVMPHQAFLEQMKKGKQ